jgi:hypothetical protein
VWGSDVGRKHHKESLQSSIRIYAPNPVSCDFSQRCVRSGKCEVLGCIIPGGGSALRSYSGRSDKLARSTVATYSTK